MAQKEKTFKSSKHHRKLKSFSKLIVPIDDDVSDLATGESTVQSEMEK
jgi:hypothetical protein